MSLENLAPLARIAGISNFFWLVIAIAVVSGIGVAVRAPWPVRGLGIGLIVGALIIAGIIASGPTIK